MHTVQLTAAEHNALYIAARKELTTNEELIEDAAHFPGEVDDSTIQFAEAQVTMLHALLDKLAKS